MVLSPATTVRWLLAVCALLLMIAPAAAHKVKKHGAKPPEAASAEVLAAANAQWSQLPVPPVSSQAERDKLLSSSLASLTGWGAYTQSSFTSR
jgi:hypothetical protein